MDSTTRATRIEALRRRMRDAEVELVALAPSDNFRYVVGISPVADERACLLLITVDAALVLMLRRASSSKNDYDYWSSMNMTKCVKVTRLCA